jgi:hypothetical protein
MKKMPTICEKDKITESLFVRIHRQNRKAGQTAAIVPDRRSYRNFNQVQ